MNDGTPKPPGVAGDVPSKHPTDPSDSILRGLGDEAPPRARLASESHGENSASFYGDPKPVVERQPAPPVEAAVIVSNAPDPSRLAPTEIVRKRPGAENDSNMNLVWVLGMFIVLGISGAAILWSLGRREVGSSAEAAAPSSTSSAMPQPVAPNELPLAAPMPVEDPPALSATVPPPTQKAPHPSKPKKKDFQPGL